MPMSHGDARQEISCDVGLTDSQHGQLKPPTRPGQSASARILRPAKKYLLQLSVLFDAMIVLARCGLVQLRIYDCELAIAGYPVV